MSETSSLEYKNLTDNKRSKIPLLLRSVERVAALSLSCETCRGLHSQIVDLGADSNGELRATSHNVLTHLKVMSGVTKHLKQSHRITERRHYLLRYALGSVTAGLSLIALVLILLNLGVTLIAFNVSVMTLIPRVIIVCTFGYLLDKRAREQGRVF